MNSVIKKFIPCLILCLGGGWLSGLFTQHGLKHWYAHLIKPYGTPPGIVFPIVWSILYTMMAIALTLFWTSKSKQKRIAFVFFGTQLFLNFIWSYLFFYLENPGLALIDLTLLWVFLLLTIRAFFVHTKLGSYLLLPYFGWVTYAFYLNLSIWIHN